MDFNQPYVRENETCVIEVGPGKVGGTPCCAYMRTHLGGWHFLNMSLVIEPGGMPFLKRCNSGYGGVPLNFCPGCGAPVEVAESE
jgi:hypothetical protein